MKKNKTSRRRVYPRRAEQTYNTVIPTAVNAPQELRDVIWQARSGKNVPAPSGWTPNQMDIDMYYNGKLYTRTGVLIPYKGIPAGKPMPLVEDAPRRDDYINGPIQTPSPLPVDPVKISLPSPVTTPVSISVPPQSRFNKPVANPTDDDVKSFMNNIDKLNQMLTSSDATEQQIAKEYDFSGNGRIGFDDVIRYKKRQISTPVSVNQPDLIRSNSTDSFLTTTPMGSWSKEGWEAEQKRRFAPIPVDNTKITRVNADSSGGPPTPWGPRADLSPIKNKDGFYIPNIVLYNMGGNGHSAKEDAYLDTYFRTGIDPAGSNKNDSNPGPFTPDNSGVGQIADDMNYWKQWYNRNKDASEDVWRYGRVGKGWFADRTTNTKDIGMMRRQPYGNRRKPVIKKKVAKRVVKKPQGKKKVTHNDEKLKKEMKNIWGVFSTSISKTPELRTHREMKSKRRNPFRL